MNVPAFIDFIAALQSPFVTSTRLPLPPKIQEFRMLKQSRVGLISLSNDSTVTSQMKIKAHCNLSAG